MLGMGPALIAPWSHAVLTAGVMPVFGTLCYRKAFTALRGGGANMSGLVSLGTTVASYGPFGRWSRAVAISNSKPQQWFLPLSYSANITKPARAGIVLRKIEGVTAAPGLGLVGTVEGKRVAVGKPLWRCRPAHLRRSC